MKKIAIFLFSKSNIVASPWANSGVECHLFDIQKGTPAKNIIHHTGDIRTKKKELGKLVRENDCVLIGSFTPCYDMATCGARHFEKKALNDALIWAKASELALIGIHLAEYFNLPYFIEQPRTVLGTLIDRKKSHTIHPWMYGGYLPENHKHSLFPEIYPPRDAYPKETWIWSGNGFFLPEPKPVDKKEQSYPGWSKLGGKTAKTKEIRSCTPEGFSVAIYEANKHSI